MSAYDASTEIDYDQDSEKYKITIPTDIIEEMEWKEGDIIEAWMKNSEGEIVSKLKAECRI